MARPWLNHRIVGNSIYTCCCLKALNPKELSQNNFYYSPTFLDENQLGIKPMRGLKLFVFVLALGAAACGCKNEGPSPAEEKDAMEKKEGAKEAAMGLTLKWLGHASFRISNEDMVIYIDPWKLKDSPHDADLVLVSHSHHDHYSPDDIEKVSGEDTKLAASNDVVLKERGGQAIMPGLTLELGGVRVQ